MVTPFWVQVFRDLTLPLPSRSKVGALVSSQVSPHVCGLKAWEIHGREALKASVNVHAGDQSTTFSRFMPTAMCPVPVSGGGGGVLLGLTATVTARAAVPPWASLTVTVKVSCLSAFVAPVAAALSRAPTVGV